MKRKSYAQTKLDAQRRTLALEFRYSCIKQSAEESLANSRRDKRLSIIVKMGIREKGEIDLPGRIKASVRFIKEDGIIVLDSWDSLDPLCLEQL